MPDHLGDDMRKVRAKAGGDEEEEKEIKSKFIVNCLTFN
jgi:hypothetical protein